MIQLGHSMSTHNNPQQQGGGEEEGLVDNHVVFVTTRAIATKRKIMRPTTQILLIEKKLLRTRFVFISLVIFLFLTITIIIPKQQCYYSVSAFTTSSNYYNSNPLTKKHLKSTKKYDNGNNVIIRNSKQFEQQQRRRKRMSSPTQLYLIENVDISTSLVASLSTASDTISISSTIFHWDEILYSIQQMASQLASISLDSNKNGGGGSIGGDNGFGGNYILTSLPIMYGAGLLTSASPCVWGLLPLTMSYIAQAAGERDDHKTTLPALAFAAGLATVFCCMGVAAVELGGIFGSNNAGSTDSISWLEVLSNGICLAMGLKLLDLINFRIPSIGRDAFASILKTPATAAAVTTSGTTTDQQPLILLDATGRIMSSDEIKKPKNVNNNYGEGSSSATLSTEKTNTNGGGVNGYVSLLRTFLLGGTSALVASPCATPVLTSILAYVAAAPNPYYGAFLLLGYSAGYSTPLLIVAATGGQALENIRQKASSSSKNNIYATIGPWVTPITGGILLWYGTDGMLHALLGDPSLAGLMILE